jgi:hypothetical protein
MLSNKTCIKELKSNLVVAIFDNSRTEIEVTLVNDSWKIDVRKEWTFYDLKEKLIKKYWLGCDIGFGNGVNRVYNDYESIVGNNI